MANVLDLFQRLLLFLGGPKNDYCSSPTKIQETVVEISVVPPGHLYEGPHWDIERQSLYFVDILECQILRYDYQEDAFYSAKLEGEENEYIGFVSPVHGTSDELVVASGARLFVVKWNGKDKKAQILRTYAEVDQHIGITRFNDGKVDPRGRIFSGTTRSEKYGPLIETRLGTLYQFIDGQPVVIRRNISVSNGMTWNEKTNKYYYTDTGDRFALEYDYDPRTGAVSNPQTIFELGDAPYYLDGMTIDTCGFIYMVASLGGKVIVFDPALRKVVREIMLPNAGQVTSAAFGGPNLDELFVTTAAIQGYPGANGHLYKVTGSGAKGLRMYSARV